jgi:hypothetical protein
MDPFICNFLSLDAKTLPVSLHSMGKLLLSAPIRNFSSIRNVRDDLLLVSVSLFLNCLFTGDGGIRIQGVRADGGAVTE